jgi:hypothetical protein
VGVAFAVMVRVLLLPATQCSAVEWSVGLLQLTRQEEDDLGKIVQLHPKKRALLEIGLLSKWRKIIFSYLFSLFSCLLLLCWPH